MNDMKAKQRVGALLVSALFTTASGSVTAQSLESIASIGVSNLDYSGTYHLLSLNFDSKAGGLAVADLVPTSFTGLNGLGSTDTLSFTGGASAFVVTPGRRPGMHVEAHGSLINTFYNSSNPPYFDASIEPNVINEEGIPDNFYAYGKAGIVELLSYGGFGAGQYYARYFYRVHGHVTGGGFDSAYITYQVGSNPLEIATFEPNLPNGELVAMYATQRYLVTNGMSHEQKSAFYVWFEADTQTVPEGSNISGMFDFSQTITLDHIEVVDEKNNPVSGWTVTAASGMDYDLPIFRTDFDPVTSDPQMRAAHASEVCSRLRSVRADASMVLEPTSLCDQDIGSIREIKFRKVGADEMPVRD